MIVGPSYAPFEDAEITAYDQPGVRITALEYPGSDGVASIRLRGVCQCTDVVLQDVPEITLKAAHVVVVFGQLHLPHAFPVVGDSILFDDDNHKYAGMIRGYFDVDLFTQGKFAPQRGRYFISVAFAAYVSNVVTITI